MPPIDFPTRSSLSRIPSPADISLDFSPNIRLTEVFLAKTGEYPLGTVLECESQDFTREKRAESHLERLTHCVQGRGGGNCTCKRVPNEATSSTVPIAQRTTVDSYKEAATAYSLFVSFIV